MHWLAERFELTRGGGASNLRVMEGLRGFAVFLVFLVHYVTLSEAWTAGRPALGAVAGALRTLGNTGVDLFFVLSGYLIYGTLIAKPFVFASFMRRRFVRIYPAFIAVFVLYLGLSFAFPAESKIPRAPLAGLAYLAENFLLLPGLLPIEPMITVAWSLSYEMFFYWLIPLVILVFGLQRVAPVRRAAVFGVCALALLAGCGFYGGHVRLAMFLSGILLFDLSHRPQIAAPRNGVAVAVLLAGAAVVLVPASAPAGPALKTAAQFLSYFVLCFACFRRPDEWLGRTFSWTPLRWLGNMSYSYYLLHGLALRALFLVLLRLHPDAGQGALWFWALLPVLFGLTLLPTAALYLAVERPFSLKPRR